MKRPQPGLVDTMMLVHMKTGQLIKPGDRVVTFRGTKGKLVAAYPPRYQGSSGRVIVLLDGPEDRRIRECEYYPGVIDAIFTMKEGGK